MVDRIAIVTGASSGIGKAIYEGLGSEFMVIGISRNGPDIRFDLSELSSRKHLFLEKLNSKTEGEHIDLLVNCAGLVNEELGKYMFEVNFWAPFTLSSIVRIKKGGMILNIASVSALVHDAEFPIYSASKAALVSITKSLAKKFAPDVRVNCISPGFYKSNLFEGETPGFLINSVPLKYEEDPKNLIDLVLAMYRTSYMTGANIVVDGGLSL